MCGLVGIITKAKNGFNQKENDAFAQLLYADQLRGIDGTGIFYNSNKKTKNTIRTLKAPYKSSIFLGSKEFAEAQKVMFQESSFAIGHNRAATRGEKTHANTHPFREKHITLVHNGTLSSHKELHDDKSVEVDSHAICHSIANIGAKETLKKIDGAFALIWYDQNEKTLNFCRNWQRPLHIIECEWCFILVSELELGLWIAKRNDLKVVKQEEVEVKKLYKFSVEETKQFTKEDVEYYSYVFTSTGYQGSWYGHNMHGMYEEDNETWYSKSHSHHKKEEKKSTKKLPDYAWGTEVRFKPSPILRTLDPAKNVKYLEGDLLISQSILSEYIRLTDFEDAWRIRYFGPDAVLEQLMKEKELVGKINITRREGGDCLFTVTDVRKYVVPAKNLPAIMDKSRKQQHCECCDQDFYGEGQVVHTMLCCPLCVAEFDGSMAPITC